MDEEKVPVKKVKIPKYKVFHSELKREDLERIVVVVDESLNQCRLEKDCCVDIIKKLAVIPELDNIGQGEWQCFVGKYFASSLTYDTGVISFFSLPDKKKSILVFKA